MPIIDTIKKGAKVGAYLTLVTGASIQTIKLLQKDDGTIDLPTTLPLAPESVISEVAQDVKPVEVLPPSKPTDEEIAEIIKQSLTEEPSSMDEYFQAHKNDEIVPAHVEKSTDEIVKEVTNQVKEIIKEMQPELEVKIEAKPEYKKIKNMIDHNKKHHKSKKYCVVIKYQPDTGVGDMIRNKLLNNT